jgi:5S rRNA maturation endonuclease (ribonuclease M5)
VINALKVRSLWPDLRTKQIPDPKPFVPIRLGAGKGKISATYDYTDEEGELLYQAVRYEPKDFRQRKPTPDGGWLWTIKDVQRVLYRLPEVKQGIADGKTIYIVEGEKDVETARAMGLVATCNAMGADNGNGNKWIDAFGDVLAGADVIIVPDQDDAGTRHVERVIETLKGKAKRVRVANPAVGKDLTDWVSHGATEVDIQSSAVDAFEVVQVNEPVVQPSPSGSLDEPADVALFVDAFDLMNNLQPTSWLVKDYIEMDSLALIYGAPNAGKSMFAVDIACCVANNFPWYGKKVRSGHAYYIAGEGWNALGKRFMAWHLHRKVNAIKDRLHISTSPMQTLDEESVVRFSEWIAKECEASGEPPSVIIVDTLARNFGPGDENSTQDMSRFIQLIDKWVRKRFKCCVLLIHHSGHNAERARGSSALKAALDAEYEVARDAQSNVVFTCKKMKDAEYPNEMLFKIMPVAIPGLFDEDGEAVTSATIDLSNNLLGLVLVQKSDKTPVTIKDALTVMEKGWIPSRELAQALGVGSNTALKAVKELERLGLAATGGSGKNFKWDITEKGRQVFTMTGSELKSDKRFYKSLSPGVPVETTDYDDE